MPVSPGDGQWFITWVLGVLGVLWAVRADSEHGLGFSLFLFHLYCILGYSIPRCYGTHLEHQHLEFKVILSYTWSSSSRPMKTQKQRLSKVHYEGLHYGLDVKYLQVPAFGHLVPC